mgnify:CR=1 FL=1|tara:strand:+ start:512 stop:970 length:459 start_codon:yes stop_codon:yes gene_type:complete
MIHCNKLTKIKTMEQLEKRRKQCNNYKYISIQGFDLSNTHFEGEDFSYSNLKNVKFNNSNLNDAIITYSKLEGTDFTGAKLFNTTFKHSTFNDKTKGMIEHYYNDNIYTQKRGLEDMRKLDIPLILGIGVLLSIFAYIIIFVIRKNKLNNTS